VLIKSTFVKMIICFVTCFSELNFNILVVSQFSTSCFDNTLKAQMKILKLCSSAHWRWLKYLEQVKYPNGMSLVLEMYAVGSW